MPGFSNHLVHLNPTHFLQSPTSLNSNLPLSNQQPKMAIQLTRTALAQIILAVMEDLMQVLA